MKIDTSSVKELREQSGAGVMECRNALEEAKGNFEEAFEILKKKSLVAVQKKAERQTGQGIIECYIHTGGRIGAMVELNCETDFVARTDEFKELAHLLAMQVAAQDPICVSKEDLAQDSPEKPEEVCLLFQPYIKCLDKTVQDIINETIAKLGENIRIKRFVRFQLGKG